MAKRKAVWTEKQCIELMLEEYRSLREEVLKAISARFHILSFGMAGIAVLAACSAKGISDNETRFAPGILCIAIPLICVFTFYTWYSEMRRARRASWYLWGAERRLNSIVGKRLFSWEQDLREGMRIARVFRTHYYLTAAFFAVIATVSLGIGLAAIGKGPVDCVLTSILAAVVIGWLMWRECRELHEFDIPDPAWPQEITDRP